MFFILHFAIQINLQNNYAFTEGMYINRAHVVFFSSRFQSERESGDRNFAIGYYLKEKKVSEFCFFFRLLFHLIK